jgi:hypothetical protein
MVTACAAGGWAVRVTAAVPSGVAVAAARASTAAVPGVVMTVAGFPGSRPRKVTATVTADCRAAAVPPGPGAWVMVEVPLTFRTGIQ